MGQLKSARLLGWGGGQSQQELERIALATVMGARLELGCGGVVLGAKAKGRIGARVKVEMGSVGSAKDR